jgi:hypothetical protein
MMFGGRPVRGDDPMDHPILFDPAGRRWALRRPVEIGGTHHVVRGVSGHYASCFQPAFGVGDGPSTHGDKRI